MIYTEGDQFTIRLRVKKILFSNADSFFRIIKGTIIDHTGMNGVGAYLKKEETVHLTVPLLDEEDLVEARFTLKRSDKFGYFLSADEDCQVIFPKNENEMEQFLVRKLPGVGIKTAKLLVDTFGMDVVKTVANDDHALDKVCISAKRADKIREALSRHQSFNQLASFLYTMNLPLRVAIAIYEKLGADSLNQVQRNPYLVSSFEHVTFTHADIVANALKKDALSPYRIKSAVIAFLELHYEQGDLCVSEHAVYRGLVAFLNTHGNYQTYHNGKISKPLIKQAIKELLGEQLLVRDYNRDKRSFLYLRDMHYVETQLVKALTRIVTNNRPPLASEHTITDVLNQMASTSTGLALKQRQAVFMALLENISILTGGPGTGKTHTVNTIVQTLKAVKPNVQIALLAPTGKAAKRMSEMTHMPAMTIHRKLNLSGFGSDDGVQPIEEDFVIVDEVSMVDAELFNVLLSNVSSTTRVLLVGDVDQLPSIGPGLILKDVIDSERVPVTILTEVFRQAQNSQIVMNAHRLIHGKTTREKDGIQIDHAKGDMYFLPSVETQHLKRLILLSIERQMTGHNRSIADICVLSPMRIGELGTMALNDDIQEQVNPSRKGICELVIKKERHITFREGDRVINLVNNSDKNVMNGETGFISSIHTELTTTDDGTRISQEVVEVTYLDVFEGDKVVPYTEKELDAIELAYAISIHKSQGSEFPVVITPVHYTQSRMLTRNLIYTAWTRARDVLVIIGDEQELDKGIAHIEGTDRVSLVKEKVQLALPVLNPLIVCA